MKLARCGGIAVLVAVLSVAGCVGQGKRNDHAPDAERTGASVPEATASGPATATSPRGSVGPTTGAPTSLTGKVRAGVEPNCLILAASGVTYLLLVGDDMRDTVKVGATVTVTGRAEPGRVTTCQQGTPFHVSAARPN